MDEIILNFLSLEIKEYVSDEIEYNRKNPKYVNDLTYLVQIMWLFSLVEVFKSILGNSILRSSDTFIQMVLVSYMTHYS